MGKTLKVDATSDIEVTYDAYDNEEGNGEPFDTKKYTISDKIVT